MQSLSQSQDRESLKRSGTGSVSDREKLSSPFFLFFPLLSFLFSSRSNRKKICISLRDGEDGERYGRLTIRCDKKIFPRAFVQMTPTFLFARSIEYPAFTLSIAFLSLRFEKEEKKSGLIYLFIARIGERFIGGERRMAVEANYLEKLGLIRPRLKKVRVVIAQCHGTSGFLQSCIFFLPSPLLIFIFFYLFRSKVSRRDTSRNKFLLNYANRLS